MEFNVGILKTTKCFIDTKNKTMLSITTMNGIVFSSAYTHFVTMYLQFSTEGYLSKVLVYTGNGEDDRFFYATNFALNKENERQYDRDLIYLEVNNEVVFDSENANTVSEQQTIKMFQLNKESIKVSKDNDNEELN